MWFIFFIFVILMFVFLGLLFSVESIFLEFLSFFNLRFWFVRSVVGSNV